MNVHDLSMRRKAEMIGELGQKYILFGISAIGISSGVAEVDNYGGARRLGVFGCCSGAAFGGWVLSPLRGWGLFRCRVPGLASWAIFFPPSGRVVAIPMIVRAQVPKARPGAPCLCFQYLKLTQVPESSKASLPGAANDSMNRPVERWTVRV